MTLPALSAAATAWFWGTVGRDLAKTLAKDVVNDTECSNWPATAWLSCYTIVSL